MNISIIAYWVLLAVIICLASTVTLVTKKFTLKTYFVMLNTFAWTELIDIILSTKFGLYYYIDKKGSIVYTLLYCLFVYPSFACIFEILRPHKQSFLLITRYITIWVVILTILDVCVVDRLRICVYETWRVIPYSPIFYFLCLTATYLAIIVYEKLIGNSNK